MICRKSAAPYDPCAPTFFGVLMPCTPIDSAHMRDWKLFATEVVKREVARRGVPLTAVLADLLLEAHLTGEFAMKNLCANISPENKTFSAPLHRRLLPVLLEWRLHSVKRGSWSRELKIKPRSSEKSVCTTRIAQPLETVRETTPLLASTTSSRSFNAG